MDKIKRILALIPHPLYIASIVFLVIWLFGWYTNANHGMHYDLAALQQCYAWIGGQFNVFHLINSGLNTNIPGITKQ